MGPFAAPPAWSKPKLEEFHKVMSELLENPGRKGVVFSRRERMRRLAELFIRNALEEHGASSVLFSGALSQKKKAQEVERFFKDPAARVFFHPMPAAPDSICRKEPIASSTWTPLGIRRPWSGASAGSTA